MSVGEWVRDEDISKREHFHLDKYAMQNEMMTLTSTYYLSLNENIDMDGIRGFVRLEKESPCKVPLE